MRLAFVLLVLGAVLLSISSTTASNQAENEKDAVAPSVEGARFLRGFETTGSEERWSFSGLFGRKKFEKMLINNWDELNKYKTDTIISKLKGSQLSNRLLHYLNWRSQVNRAKNA